MTNPLAQLNLRPQEKRIFVVVFVLVFIVLNWMFVRPLFGQWGVAKQQLKDARDKQQRYQTEIGKSTTYASMKTELEREGSKVLTEALQLQRLVDQQATASGVGVSRYTPVSRSTGATNQFFEDQGLSIDFTTFSTNLVEFLVGLAQGNSMIRVQEMNLKPDPSGTRLNGNILFVASYQKKTSSRATGSTPPLSPAAAQAANTAALLSTSKPSSKPFIGPKSTPGTNAAANVSQPKPHAATNTPPRTISTNKAVKK